MFYSRTKDDMYVDIYQTDVSELTIVCFDNRRMESHSIVCCSKRPLHGVYVFQYGHCLFGCRRHNDDDGTMAWHVQISQYI